MVRLKNVFRKLSLYGKKRMEDMKPPQQTKIKPCKSMVNLSNQDEQAVQSTNPPNEMPSPIRNAVSSVEFHSTSQEPKTSQEETKVILRKKNSDSLHDRPVRQRPTSVQFASYPEISNDKQKKVSESSYFLRPTIGRDKSLRRPQSVELSSSSAAGTPLTPLSEDSALKLTRNSSPVPRCLSRVSNESEPPPKGIKLK